MRWIGLGVGLLLPLLSGGGELVFQKGNDTANLEDTDITEVRLLENESGYAVQISFSEAGKEKLVPILNEGNTQISLVTDERIWLTAPIPRPMAPPEYFTISVQSMEEAGELLEVLKKE